MRPLRERRELSDDELSLILDELEHSFERVRTQLERMERAVWRPLLDGEHAPSSEPIPSVVAR